MAQQNRKRLTRAQCPISRKRGRNRESSDDTDVQLTTTRRYVRIGPKDCRTRSRVEVVLPPTKIDKSLYVPYVPWSPHQQVVADPDPETSPRSLDELGQSHLLVSEAVQRQKRSKGTRRNTAVSDLCDETDRQIAVR